MVTVENAYSIVRKEKEKGKKKMMGKQCELQANKLRGKAQYQFQPYTNYKYACMQKH